MSIDDGTSCKITESSIKNTSAKFASNGVGFLVDAGRQPHFSLSIGEQEENEDDEEICVSSDIENEDLIAKPMNYVADCQKLVRTSTEYSDKSVNSNQIPSTSRVNITNTNSKCLKKKVNRFYRKQTSLVDSFVMDNYIIKESQRHRKSNNSFSCKDDESIGKNSMELSTVTKGPYDDEWDSGKKNNVLDVLRENSKQNATAKEARRFAVITFIVNVFLAIAKVFASYLSGSLSIISSFIDSLVDITSSAVIWLAARAIKRRDPYMYPRGRTRLEPIALIIVSVIMGVASIQMIVQSLEAILRDTVNPNVDVISLCIMSVTIFTKFILVLLCRRYDDPSIHVLSLDHRNDCISNTVAIVCALAGDKYWKYFDPIGAIIVSLYIAVVWYVTGKEHLAKLSGKSAKPEFINRIVKICIEHDDRIQHLETVYVYHYGTRYLVEVHLVLDENTPLRVAHDISESLQINIESLLEVERAFVHCDYEYEHFPADEHKVV